MRKFTLLLVFAALFSGALFAQNEEWESVVSGLPSFPRLQKGITLYGEGKWKEAIAEMRKVQAEAPTSKVIRSETFFWIALAEISAGDFQAAVNDMEALEKLDPANGRAVEMLYHKGRAYYYLTRYSEAILLFKSYIDRIPGDSLEDKGRKSAAYYWTGECLYALGLYDEASEVFFIVTDKYPGSAKFEAASYRIDLIRQKKVETELLSLLKWSHEESLKTMEEYQRRERSYDQALIAYQKRIADMLKNTRLADLENANAEYQKQLASAQERIKSLERRLWETPSPQSNDYGNDPSNARRLEELRNSAKELESGIRGGGR